ncbi:phosphoribosylanthranilate isomerase [Enterococcus hulanensis]|uniref:N-(5'-phosphoribosyl)anthranilate isomerase n=1 Tax=Enterococcus hulanensis TaxID=2559929 RepID=A0ABU3F590_9ENTE|nr:phosphoribosylanthranilate isomerase [Enterococcus hulanensis]MDT2602087.1 phosphoribosylanthranilate isomerase [Enterococcus hulanensis]MDT2608382.1 phosphoribosylanthranilate isomerase [Enterococcus hulanensis]MDT2615677.1 phosphoribosylanthranilate isomerase [Enterococcus hulanensis]MDT2630159.1 phosphoribosylanthranilate isomerase [Enterococcus hulanensis]MDT2654749.1 phosphoribosylanthranilate isomerase [Enterococcus hulanensis]
MTQIKICGLKNTAAIETAVQAGADYLGFVFAESPRKVRPEEVRRLTKDLPETIKKVGVFVSPLQAEVEEIAEIAGLDLIQIHGKNELTKLSRPIIRAFSIRDQASIYFYQYPHLLLDAPPAKLMGGNGQTFDWRLVDQRHLPKDKLWLAGGLTAENVGEAISYFQPQVVDVSSGVETAGEKDLAKIQNFCQAVKAADKQIYDL